MRRIAINYRLVLAALLAVLALISLAYMTVRQLVAHAAGGALSIHSCTDPSLAQTGDQQAAHYVSCGGFLE